MKIGIICAVPLELEPFLPLIKNSHTTTRAMLTFYQGEIIQVPVVATFCGVGKTNATIATQILIDTYGATHIINSGTAGGMCTSLNIFDTVINTEAVNHDVEDGVLTGISHWIPSIYFKSCEKLLSQAKTAVANLQLQNTTHYGRMVTGDKFIENEGRDQIIQAFSPLSVDMETASIAHVCFVYGVPYLAIRTITDTALDSGTNSFAQNCPAASIISKNIVVEMLEHFVA